MFNIVKSYYIFSIGCCIFGRIASAAIAFVSVPIVLNLYGKNDYGIITLALSINSFLHMMDLGLNTGSIKYLAQWRKEGNKTLINQVTKSNMTFYLSVATIHSIIYLLIICFGENLFNIQPEDFSLLKSFLSSMIVPVYFIWIGMVFQQHLISAEKIYIVQLAEIPKALYQLAILYIAYLIKCDIVLYFRLFALSYCIPFLIYYLSCFKFSIYRSLCPGMYFDQFKIVLKYSLYVFALSVIQLIATNSRSIILGIFCKDSANVVAEYRFVEVFMTFVLSIGSVLVPMFLPKASQHISDKNKTFITNMAHTGTKYISIMMTLICGAICLSSGNLLSLYVGEEYAVLGKWMIVWTISLLIIIPNAPIASLTLAAANIKPLIISSSIACAASILLNILLCNRIGVGSAVVGYLAYVIIQISFYYKYYVPRILHEKCIILLKEFIVPIFFGTISLLPFFLIRVNKGWSGLLIILIISLIWSIIYLFTLILSKNITIHELKQYFVKKNNIETK